MLKALVLFMAAIYAAEGQASGSVALYNNGNTGTSNTAGIVRVYYNGQWGNICGYSYFSYSDANVVCYQLGYDGAFSYSTAGVENYGTDTSPTVLTNVDCDNDYLVLLSCSYDPYTSGCSNSDDITVDCYTTHIWSSPFSGMVRLQDGNTSNEGRVEVYCNGQWGTVCDDTGFNQNTGDTVCKQLGYTGAYLLTSNAGNDNSLPTWLDSVYCSYGDNCLANCQSCPGSSRSCSSGDAGVTCEYTTYSENYFNYRNTCILSNLSVGTIVGIIIGAVCLCLFCTFLVIMIPVCICCCLGVGIGAAANSGRRYDAI